MSTAIQIALTVGPLAVYLFLLGIWQGGRDPKVVPGAVDFALLVFGLGGLIAFGPVGKILIGLVFPVPSLWAWLVLPTTLALGTLLWAPRAHRRLVVYNTDRDALERSIGETIDALFDAGSFSRTLRGFEDARSGRGVLVETSAKGRTGVVEAFGDRPEALISAIAPGLRDRLRGTGHVGSTLSRVWYSLALLSLWVPTLVVVLNRDPVRSAWRALVGRLFGR